MLVIDIGWVFPDRSQTTCINMRYDTAYDKKESIPTVVGQIRFALTICMFVLEAMRFICSMYVVFRTVSVLDYLMYIV